jgi:multidrug resistance efflux pump
MTHRDSHVNGHAGNPGSPEDPAGRLNGSRWHRFSDQYTYEDEYLDGSASSAELGLANGSDALMGRHRGDGADRSARARGRPYDVQLNGGTQAPNGRGTRHDGGMPRDPRLAYDPLTAPRPVEPPARPGDYWSYGFRDRSPGYQDSSPYPAPTVSHPPAIYQERFPVPIRAASYPAPSYQRGAELAVPESGAVTRSRERVRGMNAALETGVAGVGEMAPARQPARPRQMLIAVLVAVVGLVAGGLTYKSLASGPTSFGGEVVPTHVYALSFGGTGTITAVKVDAGDSVSAGEVLATQNDSLAQANLQEANDAKAAAAAALYVDQHPDQSSLATAGDSVAAAQANLTSVTARASSTQSHDNEIISERQQAVTTDTGEYNSQCGSAGASPSSACQALAAKVASDKQILTQAQDVAAADLTAGQQGEQAAQSVLSERQAALQQVQSQASGVTVTLDEAKQRLSAAKLTVAQDEIALKATSIVAPAAGTVGAVSAAAGDSITDTDLHNPVLTVDSGPLVVSANLPGTEIGEVRAGQAVTLNIEPLHLSLPGKVAEVNQVASPSQTAVNYTVICLIEARDVQLMAGMTVNITPQ